MILGILSTSVRCAQEVNGGPKRMSATPPSFAFCNMVRQCVFQNSRGLRKQNTRMPTILKQLWKELRSEERDERKLTLP